VCAPMKEEVSPGPVHFVGQVWDRAAINTTGLFGWSPERESRSPYRELLMLPVTVEVPPTKGA